MLQAYPESNGRTLIRKYLVNTLIPYTHGGELSDGQTLFYQICGMDLKYVSTPDWQDKVKEWIEDVVGTLRNVKKYGLNDDKLVIN